MYEYDFGDTAGMTPLLKMHTLGHDFIPGAQRAGEREGESGGQESL